MDIKEYILKHMMTENFGTLRNGSRKVERQETISGRFLCALYDNGEYLRSDNPIEAIEFLMEGARL